MSQQRLFFGNGGTEFSKEDTAELSQRHFKHFPCLQMLKRDAARTGYILALLLRPAEKIKEHNLHCTANSIKWNNFPLRVHSWYKDFLQLSYSY